MKKTSYVEQDDTILPHSEKHCHLIVTQEMHLALKIYAAKHHMSLYTATTRLLRLGLSEEIGRENASDSPDLAEIRKMIHELAKQSVK